ncbi:pilus assembly PilX family protein [Pseudomonas oryzihabitans]|uniref:pilus assembly PilX family protein n=1 Tax=Pseudomonas oryzihabitans TaxID=47885 RepID=UPI00286012B4|nr:PilX N-terminal domain-containing pilus assembly protein [Pseudomonas psychrotolerans]MDR6678204.1 type IV pilus assembly protein PilX [Pseudomonas psychrotolerans]
MKPRSARHQGGAVLLVALVMLLLLTLLAITSMRETTLQNRVGGNVSEQKRAYNAAESALREAERRLSVLRGTAAFASASAGFDSCKTSATTLAATTTNLCILSEEHDLDTQAKVQSWAKTALQTLTELPADTSLGYQGFDGQSRYRLAPRWVVTVIAAGSSSSLAAAYQGSGAYYYRVTAVARSGGARFPVILQSIVKLEVQ